MYAVTFILNKTLSIHGFYHQSELNFDVISLICRFKRMGFHNKRKLIQWFYQIAITTCACQAYLFPGEGERAQLSNSFIYV